MQTYFGTKQITARAMSLGDYNDYRGWDMPAGENPDTKGYLVEYPYDEQTVPNHEAHVGYISWSPAHVFEQAYQQSGSMSFGHALEAVKSSKRVARAGWNGKGMFIFLVNGSTFTVNREPLLSIMGEGAQVNYHAHVDMKTADGQVVPWLCSQTDMLANDWCIVD